MVPPAYYMVPEVSMIPPAPQMQRKQKHTHIWLNLQCSGGLDRPFSASSTLENTIASLYLQYSRGLYSPYSVLNKWNTPECHHILQCSAGLCGPYSASNTMETTNIWLYLQCSRGLHGRSSVSNTTEIYEDHCNYNVPEIFMVPPAPTYEEKHNYICALTMLPSVHAPSSVSNTMETYNGTRQNTIYLRCSGGHHGASSASNNATHHHIAISTTFGRSSWCLQSLSVLEVFMVPPTPQ